MRTADLLTCFAASGFVCCQAFIEHQAEHNQDEGLRESVRKVENRSGVGKDLQCPGAGKVDARFRFLSAKSAFVECSRHCTYQFTA